MDGGRVGAIPGEGRLARPRAQDWLTTWAFALLALRLVSSVLLLPPWSGYDEPYHQGYVDVDRVRLQWPSFRAIDLPPTLVAAVRRWPLPPFYAAAFRGRAYGQSALPLTSQFRVTNHETQQSPLYYWTAALFLRLLPRLDSLAELYLLRLINATLALLVGFLVWRAARPKPFAWIPVALLALIPGFSLAMCRVSNDALCAALISIALTGALADDSHKWLPAVGALAAGVAPWAKLYGLAIVLPVAARETLRKNATRQDRLVRLSLALVPPLCLAICSWLLTGHVFPVMYNVRNDPYVSVFAVPWLQDAWLVVKSHLWMSGMSFLVFPTWLYAPLVLLLGLGFLLTLLNSRGRDASTLRVLGGSIAAFGVALAYHDWRSFASYRAPGGTGGWYVWAIALPEMLILTEGVRRKGMLLLWVLPTFAIFTLFTFLADVALFLESTGRLISTPRGHIVGLSRVSIAQVAHAYLGSRPPGIAVAAVFVTVASWFVMIFITLRSRDPGVPGPLPQSGTPTSA